MTTAMVLATPVGSPDAEVGRDLRAAVGGFMDRTLAQWQDALEGVEARHRAAAPGRERDELAALVEQTRMAVAAFAGLRRDGAGNGDHLGPEDYTWPDVAGEWGRDEAAGDALWAGIKAAAAEELAVGAAGAAAVEGPGARPFDRAEYLAVRQALVEGLRPAHGADLLLIDGMAQAHVMQRRWLARHVEAEHLAALRAGRNDARAAEAATAADRAATTADRFLRSFLRLQKAYRDQRRLFGTLVVAGGQVNIAADGGQQVVGSPGAAPAVR